MLFFRMSKRITPPKKLVPTSKDAVVYGLTDTQTKEHPWKPITVPLARLQEFLPSAFDTCDTAPTKQAQYRDTLCRWNVAMTRPSDTRDNDSIVSCIVYTHRYIVNRFYLCTLFQAVQSSWQDIWPAQYSRKSVVCGMYKCVVNKQKVYHAKQ